MFVKKKCFTRPRWFWQLWDDLRCWFYTRGKHAYFPGYTQYRILQKKRSRTRRGIRYYNVTRTVVESECIICRRCSKPVRLKNIDEMNMSWSHPINWVSPRRWNH